jgi:hypothetical protein
MVDELKTLLFCTAYCADEAAWQRRYRRWLDHHRSIPLRNAATFIIDDSSPHIPADPDVHLLHELPGRADLPGETCIYRFATHLGREGLTGHFGWWRSFLFSLDIARAFGFRKIVHVESDAYLLSRRIVDYVNALDSGWTVMWCPKYNFPEPAIQIIAADRFAEMADVASAGVARLGQALAEFTLPYTQVEKRFVGNRYGEQRSRIPGYADFACQIDASEIAVAFR